MCSKRELSSRSTHMYVLLMDQSNNLYKERNNSTLKNAQEIGLSFEDVLAVCSGVDEEGLPNCASSVVLQKLTPGGEAKTITEIPLKNTSLDIITYRGCTVVQAHFAKSSSFEYKRVYETVGSWLNNPVTDKDGGTYVLSLVAVPLLLDGLVYLTINSPVYAVGTQTEDGHIFVMSFDTFSIQVFEDESIDVQAINNEIQAQLAREIKKNDDEIAVLEKEYNDAQETGMNRIYEDSVKHDLNASAETDNDSNNEEESSFRFTHKKDPFAEDSGDDS